MRINLFPFGHSEEQKAELRTKLNLPPEIQLDLAYDVVHGLNDLTRSIAGLHPHKMSMAILGAQPSPLRELITGFAAQGFAVQELPVSFSQFDESALKAAFEKLKKDTLFILCSVAEPLTGAMYPLDWIRAEAPKKNIFVLMYQSLDALKKGLIIPKSPFEGVVADPLWGDEHTLTVVLKGERCQGERLFWGEPHFSDEALHVLEEKLAGLSLESQAGPGNAENPKVIQDFEKTALAKWGAKLLDSKNLRVYDRAVLFIPGVNGESLAYKLSEKGFDVATAAACAWNSPHLNHWLPKLGFSTEEVQDSLIIPLKTLSQSGLEAQMDKAVTELRKISGHTSI